MKELEQLAFKQHYVLAVESIEQYGVYWFTDTRTIAGILNSMLRKAGHKVLLCEIAPRWEQVIYESSKFTFHDLSLIAQKRHVAFENDVPAHLIPIV